MAPHAKVAVLWGYLDGEERRKQRRHVISMMVVRMKKECNQISYQVDLSSSTEMTTILIKTKQAPSRKKGSERMKGNRKGPAIREPNQQSITLTSDRSMVPSSSLET